MIVMGVGVTELLVLEVGPSSTKSLTVPGRPGGLSQYTYRPYSLNKDPSIPIIDLLDPPDPPKP